MRLPKNPFALRFYSDWIYSGQTSNDNLLKIDHTFFGISDDYKLKIHAEIFDFLFQAQGGFTYTDVYTMPISIRNYYFSKLGDILQARAEANDRANRKPGRRK